MNRRNFLQMSAATVAAAVQTELQAGVSAAFPVIDCHTHFYDPGRPQGVPWPGRDSSLYRTVLPADLRRLPQHLPVTGTIVVEASSWLEDNDWLLELAQRDPFIVGVVGNLDVLAAEAGVIAVALVVSTVATLVVSVVTFRLVARLMGDR